MERLTAVHRPTEVVFGRPVDDKDPMRPMELATGAVGGNLITASSITPSEYGLAMEALNDIEHPPPIYSSTRLLDVGRSTDPQGTERDQTLGNKMQAGARSEANAEGSFPLGTQPSMHRC